MTVKEFKMQYALGSLSYTTKIDFCLDSNTPKEVLTILSKEKCARIRMGVAANDNTPIKVVYKLLADDDSTVILQARIHLMKEAYEKS